MRSIETEYKETKMKAAVDLYQSRDPAMKMVLVFEECAQSVGRQVRERVWFAAACLPCPCANQVPCKTCRRLEGLVLQYHL